MVASVFSAILLAAAVAAKPPPSVADYIRAAPAGNADGQSSSISASLPLSTSSPSGHNSTEPCAQISRLSQKHTVFPADVALACLHSVPLHKDEDMRQLAGLKALFQYQSDFTYLKNPPPGYLYPGVDIMGGLDKIQDNLSSGFYTNEYDYQLDITKLVAAAYDGHFAYQADIVNIFGFARYNKIGEGYSPYNIFSISTDGTSLPDVYSFLDLPVLAGVNTTASKPSPITKINNVDVQTWINNYASNIGNAQDPDANYNAVFPNIPQPMFGSGFSASLYYQGTDTVLTFANGTTAHVVTKASSQVDFSGVSDGSSFFEKFCTGNAQKEAAELQSQNGSKRRRSAPAPRAASSSAPAVVSTQVPYKPVPTGEFSKPVGTGFPVPLVAGGGGTIAGYLPKSHPDLAVLAINSFQPPSGAEVDFEDVTRELLASAKAQGKTKLIIDLRGNGGGDILLASDLFKQLFPAMTPYGAGNLAAQPFLNATGSILTNYYNRVPASEWNEIAEQLVGEFENANVDLTASGGDFSSWAQLFGPQQIYGGNFTSLVRRNLSNIDVTQLPVYGYVNDTKPQPQTFVPQDIILLQDGTCASTCTIFSEFMKSQAHVKQVAVGGRKQYGPMQGVGGIRGSQVKPLYGQLGEVTAIVQLGTDEEQKAFNETLGQSIPDMHLALNRAAPSKSDVVTASVNFENNIREGDMSRTPLQYVYEASDCRFFYTAKMFGKQELVWDTAYSLMFGNGTCIQGSTGQISSRPGDSYILSAPPDSATNFFGANRTILAGGSLDSVIANSTSTSTSSSSTSSSSSSKTSSTGSSTSSSTSTSTTRPQTGGAASVAWSTVAMMLVAAAGFVLM